MNKKQHREKNKKRNRTSQKLFADPKANEVISISNAKINTLINEYKQPILELFELITFGTKEELLDISTREKLAVENKDSRLRGFFNKLLRTVGIKPPLADLNHLVGSAYTYADKIITGMELSQLACRKGCSWCCSEKVCLSIPEVFCIANYLDDSLSPADLIEVKEKIAQAARQVAGMSEQKRRAARIFCPLLVDDTCSIYRVRPLTCRGYNSLEESACKKFYLNEPNDFPYSFAMKEFVYTIFYGLNEGANKVGLQSNAVELVMALDIVFQNPDAESRWLQGENVFPSETVALESYQPIVQ